MSPEAPDAPELDVPDYVTAEKSFQAKVKNPVETSTYAWTIVGGTLEPTTGDTVTVTAGSPGTVTVSCIETNQEGVSSPAGTASSTIVPAPTKPDITSPEFVTARTSGHPASVEPQDDCT